jgi:hypothetical protein
LDTIESEITPTTQISDNADPPGDSVSTDVSNVPANINKNEKPKLNFHDSKKKSEADKTGVKPAGGATKGAPGTSSGGMDALFWAIGMNE